MIVHLITNLGMGGAERMLLDLVQGLQKNYSQQTVVYFYDGVIRQELEKAGIRCIAINYKIHRFDIFFISNLFKTLRTLKPQVLISSLWAANFFGRIYGTLYSIPYCGILHAQPDHEGTLRNCIDRISMCLAQKMVTVSPTITQTIIKKKWLPADRVVTIINGISVSKKKVSLHVKKPSCVLTIGAVGRLVPVKNFSLLITVFAKIHQNYQHTRLIIIGSGPEEQSLRALIKQYSIESCVDIIIGVRAEDYYDQFDIFVQPSFSEGLSRALLEAMSYSLPVIVSAHKKNHDVITHNKTGILIDPHNPEDLFNALIKLIGDQELRIRLQHAGRHHIKKHYTLSTMISHYRHIITALS